jgi:hypothetical protein
MVGDSTLTKLALAQMSCPQADPVRGCAAWQACAHACPWRATSIRPGGTVPFCSTCSTAAQILLEQQSRARAVREKKMKPDNGLLQSQQRACGMARALQKWLRGTRRPVSKFFNHLTGDDSWTWQK